MPASERSSFAPHTEAVRRATTEDADVRRMCRIPPVIGNLVGLVPHCSPCCLYNRIDRLLSIPRWSFLKSSLDLLIRQVWPRHSRDDDEPAIIVWQVCATTMYW